MIKWLVVHQWKQFFRSSVWQRRIVANIFLGLLIFLVALNLLAIGLYLDRLLAARASESGPTVLFNSFLLYYFGVDLLMRLMLQKVPGLSIRPYLHLKVKSSTVTHFLLSKSLWSLFNFLPLLVAAPFAVKIIAADSQGGAAIWLATIFIMLLCNSYLAIYIKRQNFVHPKTHFAFLAVLVVIFLLDQFAIFSLSELSTTIFGSVLQNKILLLGPLVLLACLYGLNFRFLKAHTYLDDLGVREKTRGDVGEQMTFLDRFGGLGELISLELKLILRNKRLKSTLYLSPTILLLGFMFFGMEEYRKYEFMLIYMSVFFTGMFMITYGQFILSWESGYFDTIITRRINPYLYFKAKLVIMIVSCLLLYLLLTPFAYFGLDILYLNTAVLLFNLGVNSFFLLMKATLNRQKIDLDVSTFSMQGKDSKQFFMVLLLIIIPILIYLPFKLNNQPYAGVLAIGVIGLIGLLLARPLLNLTVSMFLRQKYKIAAGFREAS